VAATQSSYAFWFAWAFSCAVDTLPWFNAQKQEML
jgi:hypothetical protein